MTRPLTALVSDHHRLLRGLLLGVDPTREHQDSDSTPMLVLIQMIQHIVHEEHVLVPLIEQPPPDGSPGRSVTEGLARLERCLTAFEQQALGSPAFEAALADLQREFEQHADAMETEILPLVDERIDVEAVEGLRTVLGPSAAEVERLPDPVRRELADPGWPRTGLVRTLRGLFETKLRQQEPRTAGRQP